MSEPEGRPNCSNAVVYQPRNKSLSDKSSPDTKKHVGLDHTFVKKYSFRVKKLKPTFKLPPTKKKTITRSSNDIRSSKKFSGDSLEPPSKTNLSYNERRELLQNFSAPSKEETERQFKKMAEKASAIDFSSKYVNPKRARSTRKSIFYHINNISLY